MPVLAGAGVFVLARAGGTYSLSARTSVAILVWWSLALAVLAGYVPRERPARPFFFAAGLLAAYAGWTGLSVFWASSAEHAFDELDRVLLYLGVLLLTGLVSTRANGGRIADGLGGGIAVVGLLALGSRLLPDVFHSGQTLQFLGGAQSRLSYPLGYWTGLSIFIALGLPLLLRAAVVAERPLLRALAVAPLPALVSAIYLTSSRAGAAVAVIGTVAYLLLSNRRWAVSGALLAACAGSAVSLAVLLDRSRLVDHPLQATAREGRVAALWIVVACLVSGGLYALGRLIAPAPPRSVLLSRALWAAAALAVVAALAASHPLRHFNSFRSNPPELTQATASEHILSSSSNGRWQLWGGAAREWVSRPLIGRGAGSFGAWWAEHGSLAFFVNDAHSLYFESLGELGLIGFILIVAALACGAAAGVERIRGPDPARRELVAALAAAFVAYLVAIGMDWMWEMTVVTVVGIAVLGLLTGPGTAAADDAGAGSPWRYWRGAQLAVAVVAVAVILAETVPLVVHTRLDASAAAVARGDLAGGLTNALAARSLQPWATSPYLQLALIEERASNLDAARAWIQQAIERDNHDWRLWLVAARLQTKSGLIRQARVSLHRARDLDPRSPLWRNV